MSPTKKKPARRGRSAAVPFAGPRHDPFTSLVLVIPVFLVYHVGILLIDLRNGVDLVSALTFALLERSVLGYLGATVGIALGLGIAAWLLRRHGRMRAIEIGPVAVESLLLAVGMAITVGWATQVVLPGQVGPRPMGPVEKIVMAAGAGFHEELVFRAGIFAGLRGGLVRLFGVRAWRATLIAVIVSSLLFSAVHYVGALGDPLSIVSFTFRFFAGAYLAMVYAWRGFAVAVYTHAVYDLLVFFVFQ